MRIPFTKTEVVVFDNFTDTTYFFGMVFLSGGFIEIYIHKNITDGFTFLFTGLICMGLSYFVPTVSLLEYCKLCKAYKLKKLEEWRK